MTRNLAAFARFLRAVAFSQGAQLNTAEVARECSVERKTVAGYLEVLHDLLLARTLDPFTRRAKRRLVQHGKFYFFDAGVFRALRPKGPLDRPAEIDGAALEGLVLQELIATNDLYRLGYEVQFWRTATDHEVDFVLYGPRGLHAIEVKHTGVVRQGDLAGLRAFMADYPEASGTLLFMGERAEQHGEIAVRPVGEVLAGLGGWLGLAGSADV